MAEAPRFYLVLGPSGAGKSSIFDGKLGVDVLNRDHLLQKLSPNGDTRHASREARMLVRHQESEFIRLHLARMKSFATERTFTYASELKRVEDAKGKGFHTTAIFIAAGDSDNHVVRAQERFLSGGHYIGKDEVREIYVRSMRNLPLLMEAAADGRLNRLTIFDNSLPRQAARHIDIQDGLVMETNYKAPQWLRTALENTPFQLSALRYLFKHNAPLADLNIHGVARRAALDAKLNPVDVIVSGPFARNLGAELVLRDMENVREDFILGVSRKSIIMDLAQRGHKSQRGAVAYAEDVLAAVEEQTGWIQPERELTDKSKSEPQPNEEEIAVRLTERQAQLLLADAEPDKEHRQLATVLSGEKIVPILNGCAELAFSPDSRTFYAVLDRRDKDQLDKRLTSLNASRGRDRERE